MLPLLALLAAAPAPDLSHWSIVSVDRQALVAVDTKPLMLGTNGGQTAMLTVVADPEPGTPTVSIVKWENDCRAKKQRINDGLTEVVGAVPQHVVTTFEWEQPPKGSLRNALVHQACDRNPDAHVNWVSTPLTTTQLVDFYFVDVLGRKNPLVP